LKGKKTKIILKKDKRKEIVSKFVRTIFWSKQKRNAKEMQKKRKEIEKETVLESFQLQSISGFCLFSANTSHSMCGSKIMLFLLK
jgi:hypothetical protein